MSSPKDTGGKAGANKKAVGNRRNPGAVEDKVLQDLGLHGRYSASSNERRPIQPASQSSSAVSHAAETGDVQGTLGQLHKMIANIVRHIEADNTRHREVLGRLDQIEMICGGLSGCLPSSQSPSTSSGRLGNGGSDTGVHSLTSNPDESRVLTASKSLARALETCGRNAPVTAYRVSSNCPTTVTLLLSFIDSLYYVI